MARHRGISLILLHYVPKYADTDSRSRPRLDCQPQPWSYKLSTSATSTQIIGMLHISELYDGGITAWRPMASSPHLVPPGI
ncbi:hypothetical protein TGAMA5MH_07069 [Trichoderma gamsii]|uniref:Uncharacterized protein n=1 Tax=Trichoderma gamsii TaxID=398673 RepID=A0A2K0T6P5_9HYPO|nr:hypothetical protein TGAMA5MH_07069 [Trichoderma gamsii]